MQTLQIAHGRRFRGNLFAHAIISFVHAKIIQIFYAQYDFLQLVLRTIPFCAQLAEFFCARTT